ncbi:oligopeptide ABC transporter permease [Schleiferilactobacillus perolens]|jgi:oligopeptide transport system permease protein|uniref:ABC-type dipeptide oligopeptide nickel transport system, permease component n=1 Tax=Schleiferilactobacillus perolens DSM 12744 TaxID=1423792 RepID=A0A0R1MTJ1_9LACO|nr:oligopeptide ABC transporter permease [Schleiferilactobacillus perolens]KRL08884.1 ABC-type dipeptide oligopeptide nickel transport system, permease component [Schleiferilactobacillus perolens DSM 12744]MCI2170774.1 ABC transporter permease [Schleiferilactobacillus perolens]
MVKYILKRIGFLLLTLFLVASITFFLMKLLPGTPFNNPKIPAAQQAILAKQYGLDLPLWQQYVNYMVGIVHGNFGESYQFAGQTVSYLISTRIGPSLQLGVQAMIVGTLLGILLGAIAAIRKNTWVDAVATIFAIIGRSIPNFVFAALLQFWLAYKMNLFPIALWDGFSSSILPTLALAMAPLANTARFMRTEMVDVLNSDYIELAKSKGESQWQVVAKHAMRNSMIPIVTIIGPMAVDLMLGSLVVENVFAIPGIGQQFVQSITTNDYPVIMGLTILYSVMLTVVILVVDVLYGIIDPRIRLSGEGN